MDMIVDRLSAIELSASRIVASAASEKKRLEQQAQEKMDEYDRQTDRETQEKLKELQKTLDAQMKDELSGLKHSTEEAIRGMEKDYDANHEALADQILQKMIKG